MDQHVDFVIITPLEEERDAIIRKLRKVGTVNRIPPTDEDIRVYFSTEMPIYFPDGSECNYKLIIMSLLGMGRIEAANATGDAIRKWNPRYVLLVGIAGGLAKAGVELGDILIADQIADYELQKLTGTETKIRWQVHRVDPRLLIAAKNMISDDWINEIEEKPPRKKQPKVQFGPICTGDKVIANSLMDEYREVWDKLIGVEMEAGGTASAAFQAAKSPGFFMVRGVSDFADGDKDSNYVRKWRNYACDVAATYLIAFLRIGPVTISVPNEEVTVPKKDNIHISDDECMMVILELNGPAWEERIREYQQKAMKKPHLYVEPQFGDPILYFPTDEGKKLLLQTDLQEAVIKMLQKDNSMENNILLLKLGISKLQEKAKENQIELDILLGVIASYADKIRKRG